MTTQNNQPEPLKIERPASLAEVDGKIVIPKEDAEKFFNAADKAAQDAKKYADEAGGRRVALDKIEKETRAALEARDAEIAEMKKRVEAADNRGDNPEVAKLSRELSELKAERAKEKEEAAREREQARAEKIGARLTSIASELKLNSPPEAVKLLRSETRVGADGEIEFRTKDADGKDDWVTATADNLVKLKMLSPIHFPADSGGGSGGTGGGAEARTGGVDWSRIGDFEYHKAHEKEIDAALRAQKGG